MTARQIDPVDPNPFMAAWRHRWVVLAVVLGFLALGALFSLLVPPQYASTALLTVERPSQNDVFATNGSGSEERFVAAQLEILRSSVVARRASELLARDQIDLSPDAVDEASRVTADGETNFVEIRFRADAADVAQRGAAAIVSAYQAVVVETAESAGVAELDRLDGALDEIGEQILALREQRESILEETPGRSGLDDRLADLVERLARLGEGASADDVAAIAEELRAQQLYRELESSSPELDDVLRREASLLDLQETLLTRRGEVQVGVALAANSGVTVFSPAGPGTGTGVSLRSALVISAALGLLAGGGAAYFLASRRQSFEQRSEPESVLGAPLLAAVPDFGAERVETVFPVRDAPWSVASESFRFAAAAFGTSETDGSGTALTAAVVSPTLGDGKTVVAANLAMSAAREGRRVLIIDADLGNQSLSRLLRGFKVTAPGLTDIVERNTPFDKVAWRVDMGEDLALTLLSGGVSQIDPVSFFRSDRTRTKLAEIARDFDLVVFDAPPLLHIAYSGLLCRAVDEVVVVVRHESDIQELAQAKERLDFLGVAPLGYVYNFAPLGRSIAKTGGSVGAYMEWQGLASDRRDAVPRAGTSPAPDDGGRERPAVAASPATGPPKDESASGPVASQETDPPPPDGEPPEPGGPAPEAGSGPDRDRSADSATGPADPFAPTT